ncbi:MAG: membrane protein insertion efficiency factor YidD [Pseudomonadota bacterium]|nr:membrane protein insertion efficiency factor YidD [Pseudomonadota bacterium]
MINKGISAFIRVYQYTLSPLFACLGCECRFYPTCSHYARICLRRFGIRQALQMIIKRLLRCHPFTSGGVDLP